MAVLGDLPRRTPLTAAEGLSQRYDLRRNSTLGTITERLKLAAALDFLGPLHDKLLLDAGCGDGIHSLALAKRGARVTGVDLSEDMLTAARRRNVAEEIAVHWTRADIMSLPFPDASFDRTVAISVLCLLRDPHGAVRELTRVLRPGGKLVIGELHRWSLWAMKRRIRGWTGDTLWRNARFWTVPALRELLAASGLQPGRAQGVIYYPPIGVAARMVAPVDRYLGRLGTFGAAFLIVEANKTT